ncbi:MAG: S8 family peptidase, partial [Ignavibacteria bacterium]|nr:S8 family peptidase [Ignavibacteria bacterium]
FQVLQLVKKYKKRFWGNTKKFLLFFFIFLLLFGADYTIGGNFSNDKELFSSPDTILVKFNPNVSFQLASEIHRQNGGTLDKIVPTINVHVVKIPAGKENTFIARYLKNPNVRYAEPDYLATALATTNDPYLSQQWGMFKIEAANETNQSAWDVTNGNPTVKIAILDTGIEITHQDLASKIVLSRNFTTSPTNSDKNGHGTHVAGVAAAITNNNIGVTGVGYNSSLMNVKVLGDNGSGYYSWVASGIIWAADNGAKVINMSLGGSSASQTLLDAVNYAWGKGVVLAAAAGNKDSNSPTYPAYYEKVMAVAATDSNDQKASWSTWGSWVDVAAPGVSIYSTYKNNSYTSFSGTSMASPHAAGLAGLVWATKNLCSTNSCVRARIENNADAISGTGVLWTYGRINAF